LADYTYGTDYFSGTSAAAPHISGLVALILSANPALSYRDVQQILIFSARQTDLADPDLATNGAGFVVSHNTGFGVPDAGVAVDLARKWKPRPALTNLTFVATNVQAIPDPGLRLLVTVDTVPPRLLIVESLPSSGPHPDVPTARLPLVDVGIATQAIALNLTGKVALIQRGTNYFKEKIQFAADAGAAFAVIYNNVDQTNLIQMAATDYTPIPAVFISQDSGDNLHNLAQTGVALEAQLRLDSAQYSFQLTNTLSLEHVAVTVNTDYPRRGDLRLTLLSPAGTRSVLQQLNSDDTPGPNDWTYLSTRHFYESSAGTWTVAITDEKTGNTGTVQSVSLILYGVPINDSDHDGLDDDWEMTHFNSLTYGPRDDPNGDGVSLARDQILGTDPLAKPLPLRLDVSVWDEHLARLSWPGLANHTYELWQGQAPVAPMALITNVPGVFPNTEWFVGYTNQPYQFYQLRMLTPPSQTAR
jgi:subtilisin-like proprotein convertase family protein